MAYDLWNKKTTEISCITLASGHRFKVFDRVTGDIASSGINAAGIISDYTNLSVSNIVWGISRFSAGAAISKNSQITVTTSGYCITATSGTYVVGRCLETVTSGSTGTGFFDFNNRFLLDVTSAENYLNNEVPITAAADLSSSAGKVVTDAGAVANLVGGLGVLISDTASGSTGFLKSFGLATVYAGAGGITSGKSIKYDANGEFVIANSGDLISGRAIADVASGQTGRALVDFITRKVAASCADIFYT